MTKPSSTDPQDPRKRAVKALRRFKPHIRREIRYYASEGFSCPYIADRIAERHGVRSHPDWYSRHLTAIGWRSPGKSIGAAMSPLLDPLNVYRAPITDMARTGEPLNRIARAVKDITGQGYSAKTIQSAIRLMSIPYTVHTRGGWWRETQKAPAGVSGKG